MSGRLQEAIGAVLLLLAVAAMLISSDGGPEPAMIPAPTVDASFIWATPVAWEEVDGI